MKVVKYKTKSTVTELERKMIEEQFETFKHTYLHRIALEKTVKDIEEKTYKKYPYESNNTTRLFTFLECWLPYHDMDKMINYLYLSKRETHIIHRANSYHHLENLLVKGDRNYLEIIMDWECAAITKSDKPLNAYDTLMTYYPEHKDEILPMLEALGMDSSYKVELKLTEKEKIVTVDDIVDCIDGYRNKLRPLHT